MFRSVSATVVPSRLATALAVCLCTPLASAQALQDVPTTDPPAASRRDDDTALTLGTVQVAGDARGALSTRGVFSSVDIVGADRLQDQVVDHSAELLARAPGVQLTQFHMGVVGSSFSFRGFNAEGRVSAIKLLIDGIPSNDNTGNMPYLDAVFPVEIAAIEVVRGTNDPRYGLNAIAGDVNVVTRIGGNDGHARLTVGSFGTQEVQVTKGFEQGPWSQNVTAGWRSTDSYRDHGDGRQRAFAGKWFYTDPDARWRAGLSARIYRNDALEAGYFSTPQQVQDAPRSSPGYARDDRSERRTGQFALQADGRLAPTLDWTIRLYQNTYENSRWVRFSEAGVQQERDNDETHRGVLTTMTWCPLDDRFVVEGGADAQWQDNAARRYRTAARVRTSQIRAWDFDLETRGAYVQAVIRPTTRLKLVPAYRIDHIGGHLDDGLTGARYPAYDYGLVRQPKFSAAYTLADTVTAYGNWGRTFQVGVGDGSYRRGDANLRPSRNDGWEAGLRLRPSTWLDARAAYWEQRASGEVATVLGVTGTADQSAVANVGSTLRRGWDAQLNLHAGERWEGWLSYARQRATIVDPDPSAPQTRGREIENVPHSLASAGVDFQATPLFKLSASVSAQGDYFVERTNTLGRYGGYTLLDLGAEWSLPHGTRVSLQLKNVTDRRYVYAWYDTGSSGYSPGGGRALYASLGWDF
jgi:iron complex outermembrane receptor protein